jgi:exopolyphosphatase/guanosine-5'-triphosphate,3'-diphosphate pyrophosphatase
LAVVRVAAIDIGTNTTLLLVAEKKAADGELRALREEATITRLGEGVDVSRKLAPASIDRTNACLVRYSSIVRELGASHVAVVGTSAMRDAGGGNEVRQKVHELFGVEARTISGNEEARLTFAGALSGLDLFRGSRPNDVVVFDIGGGSTELVVGAADGSVAVSHSFDVGSVRLTERHIRSDPPSRTEMDAVTNAVRGAFASEPGVWQAGKGASSPIGIAGTVTTLAAVALGLVPYDGVRVHGHTMTANEVRTVVNRLAALPLDERKNVPGLEPKRADVIVAGGLLVLVTLEALGASAMRVSDRGVRWGVAEELAKIASAQFV